MHCGDVGKTLEIWFLGSPVRGYAVEGGGEVNYHVHCSRVGVEFGFEHVGLRCFYKLYEMSKGGDMYSGFVTGEDGISD